MLKKKKYIHKVERQQPNGRVKKRKKKTASTAQGEGRRIQFELRLQSVNLCATTTIPNMPPIARHLIVFWVGVHFFTLILYQSISQLNN